MSAAGKGPGQEQQRWGAQHSSLGSHSLGHSRPAAEAPHVGVRARLSHRPAPLWQKKGEGPHPRVL